MTQPRSKWRGRFGAGAVGLSLAVVLIALLGDGCTVVRKFKFGIDSYMRSAPDYDELEAERLENIGGSGEATEEETLPEPYWTDFRGPGRVGTYAGVALDLDWPDEGPPLAWRIPIGPAYSSAVIASGLVITMEQRRKREVVVAFELETGREVWNHSWDAYFTEALSKEGPRSTPVVHGDAVFALGSTGELRSLDRRNGALNWRCNVLEMTGADNLTYGLAATPLILDDLIIVAGGRPAGTGSVIALEHATGKQRWVAGTDGMAYASPQLARLLGRDMIVVQSADNAFALDPATGDELWTTPWHVSNGLSCTQATIVGDDGVLLSAGYGMGAALMKVSADKGGYALEGVWRSPRLKTRFNNVIVHEGVLYGLDEGILTCIDPETGKRKWKGGRYGYGQLLYAQGHLILTSEDGELVLLEATPEEHRELVRIDSIEGMTLNTPALAHGFLIVRNMDEIACYDLRAKND